MDVVKNTKIALDGQTLKISCFSHYFGIWQHIEYGWSFLKMAYYVESQNQ